MKKILPCLKLQVTESIESVGLLLMCEIDVANLIGVEAAQVNSALRLLKMIQLQGVCKTKPKIEHCMKMIVRN